MARKRKTVEAVAYMCTSSATNLGDDKDSDKRQRAAITAFARANGYTLVDEFYEKAVRGSCPVAERPGFAAMLERIAWNGVRAVLVESPDRFARDLIVQLTGHGFLKKLGIALIPTTAPDYFTQDTPTGVLVRQVLGAVAEFQKAELVAKLKAARDRKIETGEKCGGRHSYAERDPALVAAAKQLQAHREPGSVREPSLRWIAEQLEARGYTTPPRRGKRTGKTCGGRRYSASAVQSMLAS